MIDIEIINQNELQNMKKILISLSHIAFTQKCLDQ